MCKKKSPPLRTSQRGITKKNSNHSNSITQVYLCAILESASDGSLRKTTLLTWKIEKCAYQEQTLNSILQPSLIHNDVDTNRPNPNSSKHSMSVDEKYPQNFCRFCAACESIKSGIWWETIFCLRDILKMLATKQRSGCEHH